MIDMTPKGLQKSMKDFHNYITSPPIENIEDTDSCLTLSYRLTNPNNSILLKPQSPFLPPYQAALPYFE